MAKNQKLNGYLLFLEWELKYLGGVNQVVANLYHQIQAGKYLNPIVMVASEECHSPCYEQFNEYSTVKLRLRSPWNSNKPVISFIKYLIRFPVTFKYINNILNINNIRVVNLHYITLSALNFSILRILGSFRHRKLILSFHGTDLSLALKSRGIEKLLWRFLLHSADSIVACSTELQGRIINWMPKIKHKTVVIYNGIDADLFRSYYDQEYNAKSILGNWRYVLNIGKFNYNKGQDLLLDAFNRLASEFTDLALVFIGSEGHDLADLRTKIKEKGLDKRVFILVDVPHNRIPTFYKHAEVFCLPSRNEAFAIVLLEAGLSMTPVVASRVGGIPELITDSEHGYLVNSGNIDELTTALRKVLSQKDKAINMAKNLQTRIESEFTWERATREYMKLA